MPMFINVDESHSNTVMKWGLRGAGLLLLLYGWLAFSRLPSVTEISYWSLCFLQYF